MVVLKNEVTFKILSKIKSCITMSMYFGMEVTNKALYKDKITFDFIIGDEKVGL